MIPLNWRTAEGLRPSPLVRYESDRGFAIFSADHFYRYLLGRRWAAGGKTALWMMKNPSKADHRTDDATIKAVTVFSAKAGANAFLVVNPFAYVATDPRKLSAVADPVGPENARMIRQAAGAADFAVAAWGVWPKTLSERAADMIAVLTAIHPALLSLGVTKWGAPRHPLRLAHATPLVPWKP